MSHLPQSVTSGTNGWVSQWARIVDGKHGRQLTWQLSMGMMEEDMSRTWGHPEVDFQTLRVCQTATGLSMMWDVALNDISTWLRFVSETLISSAADIKYPWIQAGIGPLMSFQKNAGSLSLRSRQKLQKCQRDTHSHNKAVHVNAASINQMPHNATKPQQIPTPPSPIYVCMYVCMYVYRWIDLNFFSLFKSL